MGDPQAFERGELDFFCQFRGSLLVVVVVIGKSEVGEVFDFVTVWLASYCVGELLRTLLSRVLE